MKLPFIRGVFSLFFWPRYAKRISRDHHKHLNSPEQIAKEDEEPWADQQITLLRRSWLQALLTVVLVLAAGWVGGRALAANVTQHVSIWQAAFQYSGAGLLLWVTLGQGGWSIQSMKGTTYAEQLDGWVYRVIHVVGTFLFVAGTAWSLAEKA
jgi:hypothetical protein